jgi:peptidoglycan/xylan/chitin deacetylase (PgdA/CDA1 family)
LIATIILQWFQACTGAARAQAEAPSPAHLVRDRYGAIIRGDVNRKKLALVFTGDEFGEGAESILNTLKNRKIQAAFFVTGRFVRKARWQSVLKQAIADGHYVGPHSDAHPLYASWEERNESLVTERFFLDDLKKNIAELRGIGALRQTQPILFIPPYEYFNSDQVEWSRKLGVTLFNFTTGSGSNRDYAPEGDPHFVSSQQIFSDILAYERKDPHGLNGFVLLMHLGSGRKDPLHPRLGALCDEIHKRGYAFERVDQLLTAR